MKGKCDMSVRSFLKLVEIQTKLASMIPFVLGNCYAVYRYKTFNFINFLLMLVSLLCVDMATTAVNNYMDYKRAVKKYGYGYEKYNAIVRDNLRERDVLIVIFSLYTIAILFGILLFLNTGFVVLVLGVFSFAVGILYSCGPFPISRTPYGEIFSGGVMGFIITFLGVYIHVFNLDVAGIALNGSTVDISINIVETLCIFLVAVPSVMGIANIMLANNICDIEDDLENRRYTLPIFIGKERSLKVFKALYYIAYASMVVAILFRALPVTSVFALITLLPVSRNIDTFFKEQSKKDTFVLSVKNFVIINSVLTLTVAAAIVLRIFI